MYKLVVAGGGCASMSAVPQILRSGLIKPHEIAVIDPSYYHDYQPGYTMIGGGLFGTSEEVLKSKLSNFRREMKRLFHPDINFISKAVTEYLPDENAVKAGDEKITYENLIVATGINPDFKSVPGLEDALMDKDHPAGSIYKLEYALKINTLIRNFQGGKAVFVQPRQPFKCGGAPQKIMYLTEQTMRNKQKTDLSLYIGGNVIFSAPKYAKALESLSAEKGCKVFYDHFIEKVDKDNKKVIFKNKDGETVETKYDLLHVCPPHKAPDALIGSKIANESGFVKVNPSTMRHVDYENIWSLGDSSNIPTSKTAAAALAQTPVMVDQFLASLQKKQSNASYNGYTACPLFVGDNKIMLAEFKFGGEPSETFFKSQDTPSTSIYHLFKNSFHHIYFNLVPRGIWYGPNTIFKPRFK